MMAPKSYKRGYPVAVLIGMEVDHASLWQIFSQVAKHQENIAIQGSRSDQKATYNFHENIINALRSTLKQGVKSIILASPQKTNFSQEFLGHIKSHDNWLFQGTNKATFNLITGSASTPQQVAALTKSGSLKEIINQTTAQETENLLEILEKRLNQSENLVYFSLEESEKVIFSNQPEGKPHPDYLLITDDYLSSNRRRNRLHRLMQVAQNKGIKTRVVTSDTNAGKRINQLGGIITLTRTE